MNKEIHDQYRITKALPVFLSLRFIISLIINDLATLPDKHGLTSSGSKETISVVNKGSALIRRQVLGFERCVCVYDVYSVYSLNNTCISDEQ